MFAITYVRLVHVCHHLCSAGAGLSSPLFGWCMQVEEDQENQDVATALQAEDMSPRFVGRVFDEIHGV